MKHLFCSAAIALAIATPAALAQESLPVQSGAAENILVYEPDFFAAANPSNALDMVNRIPGFSVSDGASVRGFAGAGGNVLINGARPASKDDTGTSVLTRTPASRVERIELIRGGAPGIDMQGQSVVVNVILRSEMSRQHTVTAQAMIFEGGPALPAARYEFSSSNNGTQWGFQVARTLATSDSTGWGTSTRRDASGAVVSEERLRNRFDGGGWSTRGNWSGPVGEGRVEITGGYNWFEFEDELSFSVPGSPERLFTFDDDASRADLGLRYERALGETLNLETRLIQNYRWGGFANSAQGPGLDQRFEADRTSGETIARGVLRWERSETLTWEGGGELAYNFMDTTQSFTNNGVPVALPLASTLVEEIRGEMFGQASWRRSERLRLEAGLRLEHSTLRQSGDASSERSFFYPKPRLALTFDPVENRQIRLRFERELGQLNFGDFAASTSLSNDQVRGGNLELRPQQRWISEAVFEQRFNGEGIATLTLRHDEISDVIDVIPLDGGLAAFGNIGDGSLTRIAGNVRLPLRDLGMERGRVTVNVQYDHTRVTDPTTGESRQISRVRPLTGYINFENDVPDWNLRWGVNYTPYFRETTFNPDQKRWFELHNYVTLFAEYTFDNGLAAYLAVTIWDDFRIDRDVYSDRATQALAFREEQRIDPRDFLQFRLRRTF
ncbi:TonB-dependent receptor plug domain-containing protein [Glycocaulis abyssi]|uniref:TonB-dependent receptor plug domain-containing protein n=1 Tax=Glycocaulis abyssi TaxID=1433403 RepID=A0ABV9NB96_9PROT